jgi:DNA-binding NarL/FixJ family response regulator
MNRRIRVLLVDDHEIVREGVRAVLEDERDIEVVGEASDGVQAVERVRALGPDVVLLDLVMPGQTAPETIKAIRAASPAAQVLMLTSFAEDAQVRATIGAGAIGYLLKDVLKNDLARAVRSASVGKPWLHPEAQRRLMQNVGKPAAPGPFDALTPRERSVLEAIARGRSNKQIGAELHLSEGTVKGYVSIIFDKLGVEDRTQAALYAVKHGLVPGA